MKTLILATILSVTAAPALAGPASVTVSPAGDNTLFQDAQGDTSNGAGAALFSGRNNQNLARRAVLRFDLTGVLPVGTALDSVVLTLHVSNAADPNPRRFDLYRVSQDWGEGTSSTTSGSGAPATAGDATWLHTFYPGAFWAGAGGDFDPASSAFATVAGDGFYSWAGAALTADVQGWLADGSSNHGWIVIGDETAPQTARRFDSRESAVGANRPALTLYYSSTAVNESTWGGIKTRYR